jgi:sn-glycerol 3-phosphate transport system ATP-binding protein/multiple sugar transport system ATP-binding protein
MSGAGHPGKVQMMSDSVAERLARAPAPSAGSAKEAPAPRVEPRPVRCSVRGVKKSFGTTPILRGVDVEIEEGAFAVLVGSSGCGKSTLLRLVAGLEEPDEGSLMLAGKDVTRLPPRDRDVAMVFQSYALYPHLTVRDNLAFGLKLRGAGEAAIAERIKEASAMLGLDALLGRLPKQLSGGQRQRVAMGRAIVRRPTIFLFDEPLSNLDAALRAEVRVEIRRLHDRLGATTLYVTHDQVEAMTLADTLWVMNQGQVEQKGKPLEVYEHPRTKFVATFLGSPQMNLVDATIHRKNGVFVAEGGGLAVKADGERFGASLTEGRRVTLGIRPHDLVPARGGAEIVGELAVEIVEALGFEAYAHGWAKAKDPRAETEGAAPGRPARRLHLTARLDVQDARAVRAGEAVPLSADPGKVHMFDPASGRALDARS